MSVMHPDHLALLAELIRTPSPSGFEQPVQRVIRRTLEGVADEVRTDVLGNVIARLAGPQPDCPRVMLAGHCDEIGFMVRHIDDRGFVYFAPIGGVDVHLVPGQRLQAHTAEGPLLGVVGRKPIHLLEAKERETLAKFKDLFVDFGFAAGEQARARLAIGDPLTFAVELERLQGDLVTARAFDDKMGAFIVTRVLQEVRRRGTAAVELFSVTTVQEEIGLRGAAASVYGVQPDIAIAVDVGFASDYPGVDAKELGEARLGAGPLLARGANINPQLFALLCETARQENIPVQIVAAPRTTGTDANVMQLSRGGVATALVSVPLRYMHSPVEVLSLADIEATIALLSATLCRIRERGAFIPQ